MQTFDTLNQILLSKKIDKKTVDILQKIKKSFKFKGTTFPEPTDVDVVSSAIHIRSNIKSEDGVEVVNLHVSPNQNTGHNETHILNAIYEKRCRCILWNYR